MRIRWFWGWMAALLVLLCACQGGMDGELAAADSTAAEQPHEAYYYALINSAGLTAADRAAIDAILAGYSDHDVVLLDVKNCDTAADVYALLQNDRADRQGILDGIQIFGTSDMVPAFLIEYKIPIRQNGVETFASAKSFFSDYCYSNLDNPVEGLSGFNLADNFASAQPLDLAPDWRVARLALGSGEFWAYAARYQAYLTAYSGTAPTPVCFSASSFAYSDSMVTAIDDLAYFMQRGVNEWEIADGARLYANQKGDYPSPVAVLGDTTAEAFASENAAGLCEFFFVGAGQQSRLQRTVRSASGDIGYEDILTWQTVSETLDASPYFLFLRAAGSAEGLDCNFVRSALQGGCIGAIAPTAGIAYNGADCTAAVEEMRADGNFFYFDYCYLSALDRGISRSRALLEAQQEMEAVLAARIEQPFDYAHNYQFGYHNLLALQNIGILEPDADRISLPDPMPEHEPSFVGSEQIYLTGGREIGDPIALNCRLFERTGAADTALNGATAVELDNGYVRLRLDVRSPSGGIYMLVGMYAPYSGIGEGYAVPCDAYVLVADVAKDELKAGGEIGLVLVEPNGVQKVWLISGAEAFYR